MTTKLMTLTMFLIMTIGLKAQDAKTIAPAQVTFAYPLGTNGQQSKEIANRFSFNVLYGINGGVSSFELGGLGNQNHGNVKGLQLAGIANITEGTSSGAIISGIANVTTESVNGMHIAGVANVTNGKALGVQMGGIANINNDSSNGLMLSGIANVVTKDMTGSQISFINATSGTMNGFQLGFINFANKVKGFQLGFVNVADSLDGAALGFISIARNGYYAVEATNSEVMYSNITYKMGTTKLYNIYTGGYGKYNSKDVYSFGLGLGSLIPLHKRHALAIEGVTNHIGYDNDWEKLNMLNKLNLTYQFHISRRISIVGGPSLNHYITEVENNGVYGTLNMPKTIWEHQGRKNMQYIWIGYNFGINIRL